MDGTNPFNLPFPLPAFTSDSEASLEVDKLFEVLGLPAHEGWFDVEALVINGLIKSLKTIGVQATFEAMRQFLGAGVQLAHGQAKP